MTGAILLHSPEIPDQPATLLSAGLAAERR
jgi:hypothetical protein